jgi:hypothetical protein
MDYVKLVEEIFAKSAIKAGFYHSFNDDGSILVYAGSNGEYDCTNELEEFAILFIKELVHAQIHAHILYTSQTNLTQ